MVAYLANSLMTFRPLSYPQTHHVSENTDRNAIPHTIDCSSHVGNTFDFICHIFTFQRRNPCGTVLQKVTVAAQLENPGLEAVARPS